ESIPLTDSAPAVQGPTPEERTAVDVDEFTHAAFDTPTRTPDDSTRMEFTEPFDTHYTQPMMDRPTSPAHPDPLPTESQASLPLSENPLVNIFRKLLSKQPSTRYNDARDVLADLQAAFG